jgi:uncharacterized damage-inducible protein DinB
MASRTRPRYDPLTGLLTAWAAAARITPYLVERLDPAIWRAPVPEKHGKTIAQLAAHIHNCGIRYLERTDPSARVPGQLDRNRVTPQQAAKALMARRRAVIDVVGAALREDGRIVGFPGDAARFLCYYMVHDAHHRGQITQMARLLGRPVSKDTMIGMWAFSKRARE